MNKPRAKFEGYEIRWALALWIGFAVALPTKLGNFDFRHFHEEEGLVISVSRSAPPLAALADERLKPVEIEPAVSPMMVAQKNSHPQLISSGTTHAWLRLKRYARYFEQKSQALERKQKRSQRQVASLNVPVRPPISVSRVKSMIISKSSINTGIKRQTPTSVMHELSQLVQPQSYNGTPLVNLDYVLPEEEAAPVVAALPVAPVNLTVAKSAAVLPTQVLGLSSAPLKKSMNAQALAAPSRHVTQNQPSVTMMAQNQSPSPTAGSGPASAVMNSEALRGEQRTEILDQTTPTATNDMAQQGSQASLTDSGKLSGYVQLDGGLAATGLATQLDVQWIAGGQTRKAQIDYSTGQFFLNVPTIQDGKIVATITDQSKRVLGRGEYDLDGVAESYQKNLDQIFIHVEPESGLIKGDVISAYSVGKAVVPLKDAEVYGPSQTRDVADHRGVFRLSGLSFDSSLIAEGYASESWGTRILTSGHRHLKVPIFSNRMMESFLSIVGQDSGNPDYGVIWGEVKHKGNDVAGVQVQLAEAQAAAGAGVVGPIYFNALRIPDKTLKATSENGLFAFARVSPGLHVVRAQSGQIELPSAVVSTTAATVAYTEVQFKALDVSGKVFDAVTHNNVQANVSILGSSQQVTSSAAPGSEANFQFKVPSSDPLVFVQAQPNTPESLTTRATLYRSEASTASLAMFKKSWVEDQLKRGGSKFNAKAGVMIGYVQGPAFHVSIDDASNPRDSVDSQPEIYYFTNDGKLDASLQEGAEGGGVFMINQLPPGLHTVVIASEAGDINLSHVVISEGGVVNYLATELRP